MTRGGGRTRDGIDAGDGGGQGQPVPRVSAVGRCHDHRASERVVPDARQVVLEGRDMSNHPETYPYGRLAGDHAMPLSVVTAMAAVCELTWLPPTTHTVAAGHDIPEAHLHRGGLP